MGNLIGGILAFFVGPLIWKVVSILGVSLVTYVGFDAVHTQLEAYIASQTASLSSSIYQVLAMGGIFTAINMVLSAYVARFVLMNIASLKRMIWN